MAEEETTEESTEEPKEKKSGSLVLIIVIVVLILIILVGAVVAILMMDGDDEEAVQANTPAPQERRVSDNKQRLSSGTGRTSGSFSEIGPMFPLDTFTVNLLSESGRRYLKVQMNLELSGEELGAELDTRKAVIRDIIIRLLSSKSLEEISTSKGKEKLKDQIVDQLNMRLSDGQVNNVYFTEFVVQ
ncbi:MAG: flagellar basal body-associated protein FliL [Campylobacterota bacterium]|nr:flagellar basal body-associated protein FliL [Campylobacterota bacterium]